MFISTLKTVAVRSVAWSCRLVGIYFGSCYVQYIISKLKSSIVHCNLEINAAVQSHQFHQHVQ